MANDPLNVIFGAPGPNYNPMGVMGGNNPLGIILAQYGPQLFSQILGKDVFLPGQFPAQSMMDQMVSAKYMRDSMANVTYMNSGDQLTRRGGYDSRQMMENMVGIRSKFTDKPLTDLGRAQLQNMANMVNDPSIQGLMGLMFGAQNVEDIFYGRKGSATMLANSVNQMGYYRRDAVTGQDRMSGAGLQAFTEQIYNNLYGPNADLNDVSGFSAGRVGVLANELSRRGMLPASIGAMGETERMQALRDKSNRPADLDAAMTAELDSGKSFEEIVKSETGAAAVRKVDATRVSNKLKEYTGAISAVREIFGANGMGNAPMQQLIAAMDALTQNSSSAMSPGKIENLMRRVQLASRDSGVSLDALMGLTARGGALADANGLDRSLVGENVVQAMQAGQAMRETGAFAPGFGKMDVDKAGLFALDRSMAASSSSVSRYMAVAKRIVAENAGNKAFESGRGKGLIAFVNAVESGATTYKNAAGQTIDMYRQMGENPGEFFSQLFQEGNVTTNQINSYYYDKGTQEYMAGMATKAAYAQSYEIKSRLANVLAEDQKRNPNNVDFSKAQNGDAIAQTVSREFSTAMLDEVDASQKPEERLRILQESVRRGFRREAAKAGGTEAQINARADQQFRAVFGVGLNETNQRFEDYVAERQSFVESAYAFDFGGRIQDQRTVGNATRMAARQQIEYRNMVRAAVAGIGADGSNFMQRINDVMRMDGTNTDITQMAERILGGISLSGYRDQLLTAAAEFGGDDGKKVFESAIGGVRANMSAATIDTEAERRAELDRLNKVKSGQTALASFKSRFTEDAQKSQLFAGKTEYRSSERVAADLQKVDAVKKMDLLQVYNQHFSENKKSAFDADVATALATVSHLPDVAAAAGLGGVLTESAADIIMQQNQQYVVAGFGGEFAKNQQKIKATSDYIASMNKNTTSAADIMGVFGTGGQNDAEITKLIDKILSKPGDASAEMFDTLTSLTGGKENLQGQMLVNATRFARAQKGLVSLDALGAPMTEGDIRAISRYGAVQKLLEAPAPAGKDAATAAKEKEELKTQLFGSGKERQEILDNIERAKGSDNAAAEAQQWLKKKFADGEYEKTVVSADMRDQIDQESSKLAAATEGGGGGMFAGIADSLVKTVMPPIVEELKKAFKDIKIENVSIGNISVDWSKMLAGGTQAASDAAKSTQKDTTPGGAGKSGSGGSSVTEFVGELRIIDLYNGVVRLLPKILSPTPGNSPGVADE